MFSTMGSRPMTRRGSFNSATACIAPSTAAAPPMSPFMASMPPGSFRLMPPVSKVTPLPMKTRGWELEIRDWGLFSRTTKRGGVALPCETASTPPMCCSAISFSVSTVQVRPVRVAMSCAWSASAVGVSTLGARLMRSRAKLTPCAMASPARAPAVT